MKKFFWVIVSIIWILYVGDELVNVMWHVGAEDAVYTTFNGDAYDEQNDIVYVTDNIDRSGFVYAITSDYQIKTIFDANGYAKSTFCDNLFLDNGHVYTLIHGKTEQNNFPIKAYCLVELDANTLTVLNHSNWFSTYDNVKNITISKDDNYLYVTGITEDDQKVEVYAISLDNMCPVTEDYDANIRNVSTVRYSTMLEPSEGYHFVYAEFRDGKLTTMENGNGILNDDIYNPLVRDRFENKKFTIEQLIIVNKTAVIIAIFVALAGFLFILSMYLFVKKRNRVAYMVVLWEVMLVIVFGFTIQTISHWSEETDREDLINFAAYTLQDIRADLNILEIQYENVDDFYRTENYRDISDRIRNTVTRYANGDVFENILSITMKDDECHVMAAARGMDNCDLEAVYGPKATNLVKKVRETGRKQEGVAIIDGIDYSLVCVGSENVLEPSAMVLAVVKTSAYGDSYKLSIALLFLGLSVLFVVASIIGIRVLLRQAKDIKLLGNTMLDVSQGGIGIQKPKTLGEDMSDMWSGLLDIDRNFKNLNYIKYRTFEAYYKFAPKSVETLIGKTSITEVVNGDSVHAKGTIILMSTNTNNMLLELAKRKEIYGNAILDTKAQDVLATISKYQEDNHMYKISCTSDFSEMQLLMPDSTVNATQIGTEFSNIYKKDGYGTCIFMHYTDYLYGVSIAGEEAVQFLLSSDIIRVRNNIKLLNELRLAQVITGSVYERELEKPNCRYIGFWELEANEKIDLYEVLDAYNDDIRRRREETRELFEEGLKLFYDSNFYLARNDFAKILKADYSDTVARWYLFTSEKHLDGTNKNTNYSLSE